MPAKNQDWRSLAINMKIDCKPQRYIFIALTPQTTLPSVQDFKQLIQLYSLQA